MQLAQLATAAAHPGDIFGAIAIALVFITIMSLLRVDARRRFNAVFVAGAGAAYLGSGLGPWELLLPIVVTALAYRGLSSFRAIGIAWLLHALWDWLHHMLGAPILPFAPSSSFGCAVCDAILAAWFLCDAPAVLRSRPVAST